MNDLAKLVLPLVCVRVICVLLMRSPSRRFNGENSVTGARISVVKTLYRSKHTTRALYQLRY